MSHLDGESLLLVVEDDLDDVVDLCTVVLTDCHQLVDLVLSYTPTNARQSVSFQTVYRLIRCVKQTHGLFVSRMRSLMFTSPSTDRSVITSKLHTLLDTVVAPLRSIVLCCVRFLSSPCDDVRAGRVLLEHSLRLGSCMQACVRCLGVTDIKCTCASSSCASPSSSLTSSVSASPSPLSLPITPYANVDDGVGHHNDVACATHSGHDLADHMIHSDHGSGCREGRRIRCALHGHDVSRTTTSAGLVKRAAVATLAFLDALPDHGGPLTDPRTDQHYTATASAMGIAFKALVAQCNVLGLDTLCAKLRTSMVYLVSSTKTYLSPHGTSLTKRNLMERLNLKASLAKTLRTAYNQVAGVVDLMQQQQQQQQQQQPGGAGARSDVQHVAQMRRERALDRINVALEMLNQLIGQSGAMDALSGTSTTTTTESTATPLTTASSATTMKTASSLSPSSSMLTNASTASSNGNSRVTVAKKKGSAAVVAVTVVPGRAPAAKCQTVTPIRPLSMSLRPKRPIPPTPQRPSDALPHANASSTSPSTLSTTSVPSSAISIPSRPVTSSSPSPPSSSSSVAILSSPSSSSSSSPLSSSSPSTTSPMSDALTPVPPASASQVGIREAAECIQRSSRAFLTRKGVERLVQHSTDGNRMRLRCRRAVTQELWSTEQAYVTQLGVAVTAYLLPFQRAMSRPESGAAAGSEPVETPLVAERDPSWGDAAQVLQPTDMAIFSIIEVVYRLSQDLSEALRVCMEQHANASVAEVFTQRIPMLKVYAQYILDHEEARALLARRLMHPMFVRFLRQCSGLYNLDKPVFQHCQPLEYYLALPVQRWARYETFLESLLKHTHDDDPEKHVLTRVLNQVCQISAGVARSRVERNNLQQLLRVQQSIVKAPFDILAPSRRFIRDGYLYRVDASGKRNHKLYWWVLLNDRFICCKVLKRRKRKQHDATFAFVESVALFGTKCTCSQWTPDATLKVVKSTLRIAHCFRLKWPTDEIVLMAPDHLECKKWMNQIQSLLTSNREKMKHARLTMQAVMKMSNGGLDVEIDVVTTPPSLLSSSSSSSSSLSTTTGATTPSSTTITTSSSLSTMTPLNRIDDEMDVCASPPQPPPKPPSLRTVLPVVPSYHSIRHEPHHIGSASDAALRTIRNVGKRQHGQ